MMTHTNNLPVLPIQIAPLIKRMLLGAAIALILMIIFLLPVKTPNPAWGKWWMVRPLVVISLAGAAGGTFYYLINRLLYQNNWKKALAIILSLLIYVIGLWLGTVLGLSGTLWN
jgi:hypothetical protein